MRFAVYASCLPNALVASVAPCVSHFLPLQHTPSPVYPSLRPGLCGLPWSPLVCLAVRLSLSSPYPLPVIAIPTAVHTYKSAGVTHCVQCDRHRPSARPPTHYTTPLLQVDAMDESQGNMPPAAEEATGSAFERPHAHYAVTRALQAWDADEDLPDLRNPSDTSDATAPNRTAGQAAAAGATNKRGRAAGGAAGGVNGGGGPAGVDEAERQLYHQESEWCLNET